jgi:membrane fusion protein, multidrug efflux system
MPVIDRRYAALLVGLALLGASAGCERGTKAKAAAPPPLPDVVVAKVEQRPVSIVRDFTARTEAVPTVEVRARISGVLEQVLFKEGTEVKQGQTLFVIQQEEYKAALETARAQLAKAQADLTRARDISVIDRARAHLAQRQADLEKAGADVARYRPLAEARAIPQQDLDTSLSAEKVAAAGVDAAAAALKDAELVQRTQIQLGEAAVESGKAAVIQADLNLGYTTIHSPITGIVGKVMVDRGNLVGKGESTVLTTVSSVNPIYVDFSVAEADYLRLASRVRLDPEGRAQGEGTTLDLFLTDDRPLPQKGHVVFVDRAVDSKTGTIAVRAEFPNPDRVIRPGQFARVRGVVEHRPNAVLVPQIAVQEQQGSKVVLVVGTDDKVAMRPVTVEERIGDFYLVKSGVKPAERVIVEGVQKVRHGMQVKAVAKGSEGPSENPAAKPAERPAEKSAEKPGA